MITLNQEITGNRNDRALSNALRTIHRNVRHLDIDMIQWNRNYTQMEIVFEATSKHEYKSTTVARKIAAAHGAFTMLVKHEWLDNNNEHPVTVTLWYPDGSRHPDVDAEVMSWEDMQQLCADIHNWYQPELKVK